MDLYTSFNSSEIKTKSKLIINTQEHVIYIENALGINTNTKEYVPSIGVEIIMRYIKALLDKHAAYCNTRPETIEEILGSLIAETKDINLLTTAAKEKFYELSDVINLNLEEIKNTINNYLGNDFDDRFVMHFLRRIKTTIYIEKTIDYRIHEWNLQNQNFIKKAIKKCNQM